MLAYFDFDVSRNTPLRAKAPPQRVGQVIDSLRKILLDRTLKIGTKLRKIEVRAAPICSSPLRYNKKASVVPRKPK